MSATAAFENHAVSVADDPSWSSSGMLATCLHRTKALRVPRQYGQSALMIEEALSDMLLHPPKEGSAFYWEALRHARGSEAGTEIEAQAESLEIVATPTL